MSISINIKNLRERHGLTQKEFAEIANVSDKAVSTWENGTKIPRMGALQLLADHFGILKSDLIEIPNSTAAKDENQLLAVYRDLDEPNQNDVLEYAELKWYKQKALPEKLKRNNF